MLETSHLRLQIPILEDYHDIYENLWKHEESARHMLWSPLICEEDAQVRIRNSIAFANTHPNNYFVYEKISNQAIGIAGMQKVHEGTYEDTGIALGPDFVRKGYGKQILTVLVNHAFSELGAKRFVTSCREENEASRKLQLSCGFRYTHRITRTDPISGMKYKLEFYELFH